MNTSLPAPANYAARRLRALALATLLAAASVTGPAAQGVSPPPALATALELFAARRYPEARDVLERIVAADPADAAAHHYLGRTLAARHDPATIEEGLRHLARAVELEPRNAVFLGIYGGTALRQAGRTRSLLTATRGREAMEKALVLDPDYLDAREGLFHFYEQAPWPLGSRARATAQLEEIRRRDPDLATALGVGSRINARDYTGAFQQCEEVLARKPDNYIALFHYGRCAAISGRNLPRGLACLQHCLTLEPPTPAAPSHSQVWHQLGAIHERLRQPDEARTAYRRALELDSRNRPAAEALARLQ